MTKTIEELLAYLTRQHEALLGAAEEERQKAAQLEHEAAVIEGEIRGVERAHNLLQPAVGNGAESPKQRRPRRDIKALVRAYLDLPRTFVLPDDKNGRAQFIADQIGDCRPYQVAKALAAIDAEGGP